MGLATLLVTPGRGEAPHSQRADLEELIAQVIPDRYLHLKGAYLSEIHSARYNSHNPEGNISHHGGFGADLDFGERAQLRLSSNTGMRAGELGSAKSICVGIGREGLGLRLFALPITFGLADLVDLAAGSRVNTIVSHSNSSPC